jgi:NADH-quinone oxidoreductase subunit C
VSTQTLVGRVLGLLPGATAVPPESVRGDAVVVLDRGLLLEGLKTLRDHPETRFEMLTDLTVVDYLGRVPRFEVIYQLYSLTWNHRLRVRVPVPEDDPAVASAVSVWRAANWAEREAYDLFGIRFAGHPDLRRILMYPEFTAHPLRKDYPVARREPLVPERDPIAAPWPPRGAA